MDTESLKSLMWLVLWGGAFFVMMRYGCGAHMMGGHSHGGGAAAPDRPRADPVCGMSVDAKSAAAAAVHGGDTYYFCSTDCRDKFDQAPEKYVGVPVRGGQPNGGHHHG